MFVSLSFSEEKKGGLPNTLNGHSENCNYTYLNSQKYGNAFFKAIITRNK